jgi:hypothetical protein
MTDAAAAPIRRLDSAELSGRPGCSRMVEVSTRYGPAFLAEPAFLTAIEASAVP